MFATKVSKYIKSLSWILLAVIFISINTCNAYPEGAPARICESMHPNHGEQSMQTDMPFRIELDRNYIRGSGKISITVTSKDSSRYTLKGALFIVKRPKNKKQAFGTFDPAGSKHHLKTIDCFGKAASGITQSSAVPKTILSFQWTAPNDTSSEYELHATLVRDFNSFWADYIHRERIFIRVDAPFHEPVKASAHVAVALKPMLFFGVTVLITVLLFSVWL